MIGTVAVYLQRASDATRRRKSDEHGTPPSMQDAHVGAVTFIQRSDSALRLNVHAHSLFLDGVYVREKR